MPLMVSNKVVIIIILIIIWGKCKKVLLNDIQRCPNYTAKVAHDGNFRSRQMKLKSSSSNLTVTRFIVMHCGKISSNIA